MSIIGFIISLVAALFMFIGLIPFLGWINWFTTFPIAILGAIISAVAYAATKNRLAIAGLVISGVAFLIALGRVIVGCGFF
jgi:hypothetical protein